MKKEFVSRDSLAVCEGMLSGTHAGVLVMSSENRPYAVPMNHGYENGRFYFHCAADGRKLDCIRENPHVVYVVKRYHGTEEDRLKSMRCHGDWESVIAYGRARVVEDRDELRATFRAFMRCYGKPGYEPSEEAYAKTRAIVIDVEEMTARREYRGEEKKNLYVLWKKGDEGRV